MGLFDFFKKKELKKDTPTQIAAVPESEKKYYQPDEYYTKKVAEGTMFERTITAFEDRKKTAIPSKRGLYPAEILLLEYCTKGNYPGPRMVIQAFGGFPMV